MLNLRFAGSDVHGDPAIDTFIVRAVTTKQGQKLKLINNFPITSQLDF